MPNTRCCMRPKRGAPTEFHPYNPSGSPGGITGVTTPDGRFTIVMPHPESVAGSDRE